MFSVLLNIYIFIRLSASSGTLFNRKNMTFFCFYQVLVDQTIFFSDFENILRVGQAYKRSSINYTE